MSTEQITAGKGRLRAQIRDLETELEAIRKAPLKLEAERLKFENERLTKRNVELEEQAGRVLEAALALARIVNAPLDGSS